MIRICFIITGLSTGGAETMLLKLLQELDRRRFLPEVVSLTTLGEIGPRLQALDVPVLALGMRAGWPVAIGFSRLVKHLRERAPDVVHTWMYHADLLGGLATHLAGVKALAWGIRHSNLSPQYNKRTTLLAVRICAWLSRQLPSVILTCSERARQVHVDAGYCAEKMVHIPNGFDLGQFVPNAGARLSLRAELSLSTDAPLIGVIARDDPQKNHVGFLEAAIAVHKVWSRCHFVMAGQGIDQSHAALIRRIARAGLQEHVHLLGRRDDVPRLMAALDVLASPSHGEAFPNVLGEAMACGVPCVVTDVGDSAEIVGDTGRVVAPQDMVDLAQQILALLTMRADLRADLGVKARKRVEERFALASVARRYEDTYLKMLSGV